MEDNTKGTNRYKRNKILGGLIVIGIGAVLFAEKMGVVFPKWLLTWPVLLIVLGIFKAIKSNFKNLGWLVLVGVGSLFLWNNMVPGMDLSKFILPIVLMAAGLIHILKPRPDWKYKREKWRQKWHQRHQEGFNQSWEEVDAVSNDYIEIKSVFSGLNRTVLSKTFKGGKISCVFGGVELNLTQADIQGTAVIRMEEVFGGIKLIVPSNWTVKNEIEGVFHGVEDERNNQLQQDINKVLTLQGSAVFAGIEIKSY